MVGCICVHLKSQTACILSHSNAAMRYNKKLNNSTSEDRQELLTKGELAKRLKVSTRTIDLWVLEGRIPKIKISSSARFDWDDVIDQLKNQNQPKVA